MVELGLLKLLLKEENYTKYRQYVRVPVQLKEILKLFHTLDLLFSKYPEKDKSVNDLESMVAAAYPQMREVEREAISDLCEKLRILEVSDDIIEDLLKGLRARAGAYELALKAVDVAEGRLEPEALRTLYNEFLDGPEVLVADERCYVTDDLEELAAHTIMGPGLKWRLACLNSSLGPLRAGDFGFIFARPESGKTTFLADQCTYMAGQTDKKIIWFNNEEQGEKVRLRTYQAALGVTLDELWKDKAATMKDYRDVTKSNLIIYDDATIHKNDVERMLKKHTPALVVFDQIDKIKGFNADRPDLVYGRIYQWARELAKKYQCAVIGICQSDGSGEGLRWLTMSHVAEAKTSKQAEADWILGIGRSNEGGTEDIRYLNISKNKLIGDDQTDPTERHGRFPVYIYPTIARYSDLG